jgi:hypothetical protein
MSFAVRNLSVLAYANGFTLWHYKAGADATDAPDYFSGAADMLAAGDIMMVSGSDGARMLSMAPGADGTLETVRLA